MDLLQSVEHWCIAREREIVLAFGATFFIGTWYAFPMVNTITDVWAFGGGVLRALEAHTLLPGPDVSYGTLSFYQNYVLMVLALCVGYLCTGFDLVALKTHLIVHPEYSLLIPRLASAATAAYLLIVVHSFLKTHVTSFWWRIVLLLLTFGNVLSVLLTRSGKMWILSTALAVLSVLYLYRSLNEEREQGVVGKLGGMSILTAFLSAANFSFNALFLINVPIIFFSFPRTKAAFRALCIAIVPGALFFIGLLLLNIHNTVTLVLQFASPALSAVPETAAHTLTLLDSTLVNLRQAGEAFPLLLLALIPALYAGVRDKTLALLAVGYSVLYLAAVSFVFRVDQGLALNVRHIFPLCFFMLLFLAACRVPRKGVMVSLGLISVAIYAYSVTLLSIPTTYNQALDYITKTYAQESIRIDERIFEFTLPMNRASYELYDAVHCGSTCQHRKQLESDIAFKPIVVVDESNGASVTRLPPPELLVVDSELAACTLIRRFGNAVPDNAIFDIDINLGRMLLPSFYSLSALGKNIYVYDASSCR